MRTQLISLALAIACAIAQTVPVPAAGNVTLPIDEFNRLTALANQPAKPPDAAPFAHVLKSAHLNLRVNAHTVTGKINLEGEVQAIGTRKVPLVNGMIVLDAEQLGKELPLERDGAVHSAVLTGPGEFSIALNTALPLNIETGRASFLLPVPAAGAARLTLTLPGEQTQVGLTSGIVTSRSSQNGQTIIEATLSPGSTATLWWASRLSQTAAPAPPKEVRFLSDIQTLISVTEPELALAALAKITVVQGEPAEFRLNAPAGYELTGATGPTLLSSESQADGMILRVVDAAARSHEFLITLAKTNASVTKTEVPLVSFAGTQRETGEVLVESDGAMELNAAELGGLRRMDLKELSPSLRSLSRGTLQAAFRYQKRPAETPALALDWVRFADSRVLSAIAQRAEVTTLVTTEGRSLSEIKLTVKNQAQPFLKVELPAGATILSAEVAGEKVKPVQGPDGSRVPLLRIGFRPAGPYQVSFVILNAEAPLARRGDAALALPKMDLPIGQMSWEVFLPEQLKVSNFAGDVRPAQLFPAGIAEQEISYLASGLGAGRDDGAMSAPGLLSGVVTDPSGAVVAGAVVTVTSAGRSFTAVSGPDGRWAIAGVPSGNVRVTIAAAGFKQTARELSYDLDKGTAMNQRLDVGATTESILVTEEKSDSRSKDRQAPRPIQQNAAQELSASSNVGELQRKVVGVLPIAINIPRTGNSYRFLRPLVIDEQTRLTFQYRRK